MFREVEGKGNMQEGNALGCVGPVTPCDFFLTQSCFLLILFKGHCNLVKLAPLALSHYYGKNKL